MLKVGITGGIGSGKSTVAKIFATLGVPVYYADDAGKRLMQENPDLRSAIRLAFGEEAYNEENVLNRAYLAQIVFSEATQLRRLEALVHPAVLADSECWLTAQKNAGAAYVLKEAALLFESGSYQQLDKIIVVHAPEALRISRVIERDNSQEEAVRARMAKQWPDEEKLKLADFVIYNDGRQMLIPQVLSLHTQLIQLSN